MNQNIQESISALNELNKKKVVLPDILIKHSNVFSKITESFEKTNCFIFDFDQTITKEHIFRLLNTNTKKEDLKKEPFYHRETCEHLRQIFEFLNSNKKQIYVASRNYADVIYYYLIYNIDKNFPFKNIHSERPHFFKESEKELGKIVYLSKINIFSNLRNAECPIKSMLYIDDNVSEITYVSTTHSDIQYYLKPIGIPLTLETIKQLFFL